MAAKKRTARKTASANVAGTAAKKPASKAAFVRAHANLSAREVVAKAKEQGIKMGEPYVYNVRAYDKSKGRSGRKPGRKPGRVARPAAATSSAEALLMAVAAEVGLAHAIAILQGERARVHAVLRG